MILPAFKVNRSDVDNPQTDFYIGEPDANGNYPGAYNLVEWLAAPYNVGNRWTAEGWIPVQEGEPPALVHFGGQIWIGENALPPINTSGQPNGQPPQYCAKVIKNATVGTPVVDAGTHIFTGIASIGGFPNSAICAISGSDIAQPGDRYNLYLFVTHPSARVDGHPAHTWWEGYAVGAVA